VRRVLFVDGPSALQRTGVAETQLSTASQLRPVQARPPRLLACTSLPRMHGAAICRQTKQHCASPRLAQACRLLPNVRDHLAFALVTKTLVCALVTRRLCAIGSFETSCCQYMHDHLPRRPGASLIAKKPPRDKRCPSDLMMLYCVREDQSCMISTVLICHIYLSHGIMPSIGRGVTL
jgi:hypothetical protein